MDDIGAIQLAVKVDYKQLTGLIKTTDQTKRAVSVLAKDFARTGNLSKYMTGINHIDAANRKLGNSSSMTRTQIMRFGKKVEQQTRFTDSLTAATTRLTVAQMASGKAMGNTRNKMNGNNMAIQQLGYQFGDFAVQVQGGTSAFVAFSQQGSQLAGILPMIAGPLGLSMGAAVGLSAALGILIPIGSAAGRMFMEMSDGAKTLEDALKDMDSSLSDFESSMRELDGYNLDSLNGALSEMDTLMSSLAASSTILAEKMMFLDAIQAIKGLNQEVGFWSNTFAGVMNMFKDIGVLIDPLVRQAELLESIKAGQLEDFGFGDDLDVSKYQELITEIKAGLESKDSISVVKSIEELVSSALSSGSDVTESGSDRLALLMRVASVQQAIINARQKGADALAEKRKGILAGSEVLEEENERANILRRIREEVAARKKAKEQSAKDSSDLADAERLLGEQAVAANVKNIMLTREAETKAREERQKAVLEGVAIFRAANKKAAAEKEELETRAFNRRFEAEESLMSMPLKVDKATQKKIDDAVELNRKQDEFLAKQQIQLGAATRISEQTGEELFAAQQINEMVLFKLELDKLGLKLGDEKYNQLVTYKELIQEANARTFYRIQLEKEAAEAKRIADAEAQRVNDILLDQYSRIEQELEDQAQKQKELADTIANTFGNAFMSIVDGTESAKDAFRSMARDIIKQLYQILVVEQMVQSISGAIQSGFGGGGAPQGPSISGAPIPDTRGGFSKLLGQANGGAWLGGSQVQAYANGGVVGGPTTFGMSGGRTGLMGEAGPEAIMPLKRGANGKLGVQMEGGGATTVVQNFNFSANGDDSVKKLIAQAAPKIAQMTKSEMLNDRRRGGTMKATFG